MTAPALPLTAPLVMARLSLVTMALVAVALMAVPTVPLPLTALTVDTRQDMSIPTTAPALPLTATVPLPLTALTVDVVFNPILHHFATSAATAAAGLAKTLRCLSYARKRAGSSLRAQAVTACKEVPCQSAQARVTLTPLFRYAHG